MPTDGYAEGRDLIQTRKLSRCFLRGGKAVVDLKAQLPEIRGAVLLNAYYERFFRQLTEYCAKRLVPELPEREQPLELELTYQIRLITPSLLSLTLELIRRDGRTIPAARFGAVWSRSAGIPLSLRSFFPKPAGYRHRLRAWIRTQALERLRSGRCLYDPGQAVQADRLFSPRDFYAAEKGLVLFFPPLTLGSAAEGIPEFLLTWDPSGPILPEI